MSIESDEQAAPFYIRHPEVVKLRAERLRKYTKSLPLNGGRMSETDMRKTWFGPLKTDGVHLDVSRAIDTNDTEKP